MKTLPLSLCAAVFSLVYLSGCTSPKVVDVPSTPATSQTPGEVPVVVRQAEPVKEAAPVTAPVVKASPSLIAFGATWKYTASAEGYEGDWKSGAFDDSGWSEGKTPIGFGDEDLGTKIDSTGANQGKILSVRGRSTFAVADPAAYGALRIRVMRDDGIVVYLNGSEIVRDNLPAGALKSTSLTPKALSGAAESEYLDLPVPSGKLVAGKNVVSVAVHQNRAASSDLWFDIELSGEVK